MAKAPPRLTSKQRNLYRLLQSRSGSSIDDATILSTTGWKPSSWKVYRTNGLYDPYLRATSIGKYDVLIDGSVTEDAFHRQVTQSISKKAPQADGRAPLTRALLARSADNMVLALEIFNRPSLSNRLDGFAILFCTAWEQLLKAEIIEADGEAAIFRPQKPGRRRESKSLDECLGVRLPEASDLVRKNIERIAEIRHQATHLVVPEIQAPFAHLFQAGVVNFAKRYREFATAPFLPRANIGMLALSGQGDRIDAEHLCNLYGDRLGPDIAKFATTLEDEITSVDDERFAVRVEIRMRFASSKEGSDVSLAQAAEAPIHAVVLEKPVDPEKTHPWRTTQVQERVAEKLGKPFSSYDLQCVLWKEGWKKNDNKFHRLQQNPNTPKFSDAAVDEIVSKVTSDAEYLGRARSSYAHDQRKRRR